MFRNRLTLGRFVIVLVACAWLASSAQSSAATAFAATGSNLFGLQWLTRAPSRAASVNALVPSTAGRIGNMVIFDGSPANFAISALQAQQTAGNFDVIWASLIPRSWRAGNSSILASRFFIPQVDLLSVGGHTLAWWKTYHPDWILYACNSSNVPTTLPAYEHYYNYDVPLDIHNPAVISYQIRQLLAPYAINNGYNAIAVDQVVWQNIMGSALGSGYYGCGTYKNGILTPANFVRRYTGKYDPQFATDMLNWVKTTRTILKTDPILAPQNLKFLINHPAGSVYNANETALIQNVDGIATENGFTNYGMYQLASNAGLFKVTLDWMLYAQRVGTTVMILNTFQQDHGTTVTQTQLEYGMATYLMGREQAAEVFIGPASGCCVSGTPDMAYGTEQLHPEYKAPIGTACAEYFGGGSYDPYNPHIYYRKFTGGLSVVNSGSLPRTYELARLPAGKVYSDLMGRQITNPLKVNSNDAYVLLTSSGC